MPVAGQWTSLRRMTLGSNSLWWLIPFSKFCVLCPLWCVGVLKLSRSGFHVCCVFMSLQLRKACATTTALFSKHFSAIRSSHRNACSLMCFVLQPFVANLWCVSDCHSNILWWCSVVLGKSTVLAILVILAFLWFLTVLTCVRHWTWWTKSPGKSWPVRSTQSRSFPFWMEKMLSGNFGHHADDTTEIVLCRFRVT